MTVAVLEQKRQQLDELLKEMGSVLVAFSGGVDSTFLLAAAIEVLGNDAVLAATAQSPSFPEEEFELSKELARSLGAGQVICEVDELSDARFTANTPDRCYFCKLGLMTILKRVASQHGLQWVADGSNADDTGDYRPGLRAARELGIRHPLMEAGLTKADIRALSARMGLSTHDKPSAACLASRIPYGQPITAEVLERVGRAESLLRGLGFRSFRVRSHGPVARIELGPDEDEARFLEPEARRRFVADLKALGYKYIALDLEGYRTGSMNETLTPPAAAPEKGEPCTPRK